MIGMRVESDLEAAMKLMMLVAMTLCLAGTQVSAAGAGYDNAGAADNTKVAWADVLRVDPVYSYEQTGAPRQQCDDVPVERQVDNGNRAAGTVLGAIVGGVLGSTIGKGDGRRAATVVGAVAGGAIGNNAARGDGSSYADTERRCHLVNDAQPARRVVAYDVQYRYRGDVFMSRLDFDPGDRLRVKVSIEPVE